MNWIRWTVMCLIVSCGAPAPRTSPPVTAAPVAASPLKMQHQILFRNGADEHVFDGVMLLFDNAYIVKAFAGPGVDLFTVARSGDRHRETLHLKALAGRMDVSKIGEDIFFIYTKGCVASHSGGGTGTADCLCAGQRLEETFDASGRTMKRVFPDAHGIGLTIRYEDYRSMAGRMMPGTVVLEWGGDAGRSLVIKTASAEAASPEDEETVEDFLR